MSLFRQEKPATARNIAASQAMQTRAQRVAASAMRAVVPARAWRVRSRRRCRPASQRRDSWHPLRPMPAMPPKDTLDRIDLRILQILQQDAQTKNRDLARRVALSPSACLRRIRDLEARGLITGYRAHVAIDRIRTATIVIAQVSFERHSAGRFVDFDAWAARTPEIAESIRISGHYDYLLRVVVSDLHDWKRIMREMTDGDFGVEKIVSSFLMEEMKAFKGYPLTPATG
jgi:Lrp/AsnC family transcriptional regulator, leucine-responsive regulatory protein